MAQPRTAPVLAITERAIGTDQDKKYVMVVGKDNKTAYREVKLGAMTDDLRIITSGLEAGDRIIVAGLQHVKPGDEVAPEPVAMDGRPIAGSARCRRQAVHGRAAIRLNAQTASQASPP